MEGRKLILILVASGKIVSCRCFFSEILPESLANQTVNLFRLNAEKLPTSCRWKVWKRKPFLFQNYRLKEFSETHFLSRISSFFPSETVQNEFRAHPVQYLQFSSWICSAVLKFSSFFFLSNKHLEAKHQNQARVRTFNVRQLFAKNIRISVSASTVIWMQRKF